MKVVRRGQGFVSDTFYLSQLWTLPLIAASSCDVGALADHDGVGGADDVDDERCYCCYDEAAALVGALRSF